MTSPTLPCVSVGVPIGFGGTASLDELIAQLARWIRVASAHRPRIAASYPTLIAPLPLLAAAALFAWPHVGTATALAPLGVLYALRVALAWEIRRSLFGRPAEAMLDPLIGDLAWWAAGVVALAPKPTRWRGRVYNIGRGGRLLAPVQKPASR